MSGNQFFLFFSLNNLWNFLLESSTIDNQSVMHQYHRIESFKTDLKIKGGRTATRPEPEEIPLAPP